MVWLQKITVKSTDSTEPIEHTLQQSIDNLPRTEIKLALRQKIKTLVNLMKGVDVDSSSVFYWSINIGYRSYSTCWRIWQEQNELPLWFAPYPKALFKDYLSKHLEKSKLADVLKMKQSHHKEKKSKFKDRDMEIETDSTVNEDQRTDYWIK